MINLNAKFPSVCKIFNRKFTVSSKQYLFSFYFRMDNSSTLDSKKSEIHDKSKEFSSKSSIIVQAEASAPIIISTQKSTINQSKISKLAKIFNNLKPSNIKLRFKSKILSRSLHLTPESPVKNIYDTTNERKKVKSTSFLNVDSPPEISVSSTASAPDFHDRLNKPHKKSKAISLEKLKKENKNHLDIPKKNKTSKNKYSFIEADNCLNLNAPSTSRKTSILNFDEEDYMEAFRYFDTDG